MEFYYGGSHIGSLGKMLGFMWFMYIPKQFLFNCMYCHAPNQRVWPVRFFKGPLKDFFLWDIRPYVRSEKKTLNPPITQIVQYFLESLLFRDFYGQIEL